MSRAKIEEVTLNALRTRQSLVKGERLVRHEMRAVLLLDILACGEHIRLKDDAGAARGTY